jgi:hypothetical protein
MTGSLRRSACESTAETRVTSRTRSAAVSSPLAHARRSANVTASQDRDLVSLFVCGDAVIAETAEPSPCDRLQRGVERPTSFSPSMIDSVPRSSVMSITCAAVGLRMMQSRWSCSVADGEKSV